MNKPKSSVPHPFAFFLAKGWETSNLNQICSSGAARLAFASYASNKPANLLTCYHREAVANLLFLFTNRLIQP
jgi:hypothetical protein